MSAIASSPVDIEPVVLPGRSLRRAAWAARIIGLICFLAGFGMFCGDHPRSDMPLQYALDSIAYGVWAVGGLILFFGSWLLTGLAAMMSA